MKFDASKLNTDPSFKEYVDDRSMILTCADEAKIQDKKYDVIVVGAGPIGAAMATSFARDGRKVLIVERSWDKPDRIVGELMQPGGVQALEKLGLVEAFYGIGAVEANGYHVAYKDQSVYIPYNIDAETGKRIKGVSFHHGDFLANMRAACKAEENVTCLEAEASELVSDKITGQILGVDVEPRRGHKDLEAYNPSGDTLALESGQHGFKVYAPFTVVADGIYSKFRTVNNPSRKPTLRSHFVGFVIKHEKSNPLPRPHNGHVFLTGFTPVLMYQLTDNETRVLIDVPGTKLPKQSDGSLRRYIEAAGNTLPSGVREAFLDSLENSKRLRVMTNSSYQAKKIKIKGAVFVGDSFNMRHPLTGGGMTVGYWDCVYVMQALSPTNIPDLSDTDSIIEALESAYTSRRPRALVVNTMSVALYSLFAADNEHYRILRDACFQYFTLGGDAVDGPSGLLSGTNINPLVLAHHFFSVALYALFLQMCKSTTGLEMLQYFIKGLYTLFVAASIFIPLIISEMMS
ncbi:Squalene monooxygenase [Zancudomyces culisetae]|uniref:Squalene monooxygenase n=1 Tax=Zancudomyces culisetae TaxID=1213189 RepID=A0A1R1PVE4_ZANCU|nr:Squalene monooxygenase [Zancudomyces culisetae]|eukprot:OMH84852.1 Squalene monooxygenase [Zancudomyces culisetae]